MTDEQLLELIEKLNKDYIECQNSREYQLGKKVIEIKQLIQKFQFLKLMKKIRVHRKIKPYYCLNPETLTNAICNKIPKNKKIVIYTCIYGNYDSVYEPLYSSNHCEYVLFTDDDQMQLRNMKKVMISEEIIQKFNGNGTLINRYYKLNPGLLFPEYDYAIYIDGSVEVISDLTPLINNVGKKGIALHQHRDRACIYDEYEACKIIKKGNISKLHEQIMKYLEEGFPKNYGMAECGIIVTDLQNSEANHLFKQWWEEFRTSDSLRDQIALPYILWKNNIAVAEITTLGKNIYTNPKIRVHNLHKK